MAEASGKKAKNVIFFLGDGTGQGPITAARILSKGMTEGKYKSLLELDQMDFRGIVTTSGADSISTDSANVENVHTSRSGSSKMTPRLSDNRLALIDGCRWNRMAYSSPEPGGKPRTSDGVKLSSPSTRSPSGPT